MRYFKSFIPHIASYASIIGLYFTAYPWSSDRPHWHWLLIAAFGILSGYTAWMEFITAKRESHVSFGCSEAVSQYMDNWVSQPGRTVIFSRDLSWGADLNSRSVLIKKAQAKELTVYIESMTSFAADLQKAGAKIYLYHGVCLEPMSRFTIVGYGKEGARIAVAAPRGGRHTIYEFGFGEHPIFSIAQDLLRTIAQGKTNA